MPSSSARLYLYLLLGIIALLGASGGLGYYFFAILPEREADEAGRLAELAEADLAVARQQTEPGGGATVTPGGEATTAGRTSSAEPWAIGPSGREAKFGLKAPGAPPLLTPGAGPGGTRGDRTVELPFADPRGIGDPTALPGASFGETICEPYGHEVDFTRSSGIEISGGRGEVCLEIERPHLYPDELGNLECGPPHDRVRIDDLDCRLRVCLRMMNRPGPDATGAGAGSSGSS